MAEILAPVVVTKDKAFYPFSALERLPESVNSEIRLPSPFPVVEAPLDLTSLEDFAGVSGSILLAAVPESLRQNIRIWCPPFGNHDLREEQKQGKLALVLGTRFKVATIEQFLQIFRYGAEIHYSPDKPVRLISGDVLGYSYFHCTGLNTWIAQVRQNLARSEDALFLENYQSDSNTGGNIATRNEAELIPQDVDKLQVIRARIVKPPFGYRTAEEIMARTAPRFPSLEWIKERFRRC